MLLFCCSAVSKRLMVHFWCTSTFNHFQLVARDAIAQPSVQRDTIRIETQTDVIRQRNLQQDNHLIESG